jgi:hypothetical protein
MVVDSDWAARLLWFDAFVGNVDRSWRNPNLLLWHRRPYAIDHGAALTFHHSWPGADGWPARAYDAKDHVVAGMSPDVASVDGAMAAALTTAVVVAAVADVPDEWLADEPGFASVDEVRRAYVRLLGERVADRGTWLAGPTVLGGQPKAVG